VHFDESMLETVLELRPEVVSFHFGLPVPDMVRAIKDVGSTILSTATTVHETRLLEGLGVDLIVAQGWEAGGHRGTFASPFEHAQIGTFALVPRLSTRCRCRSSLPAGSPTVAALRRRRRSVRALCRWAPRSCAVRRPPFPTHIGALWPRRMTSEGR
jgi:NAD(P)H-dependent flavin oxidoreductase YrpB (nitropropane dioxygenase family)